MIFFIIKKMQEKKKISIENRSLHRGRYKFIELSRGEWTITFPEMDQ